MRKEPLGAKVLLVIVAKEPVPGRVKTRLFPHLSPEEATGLYESFLRDTLGEMGTLQEIDLAIAFTPAEAKETFTSFASDRFGLFPQRGKDLGERLLNIFVEKLGQRYEAVSIINSDSPDLQRAMVMESFRLLLSKEAEVVFGPCHDGGYYLVGLNAICPELFRNIPWSTERVLSISLEKARRIGLKARLLPFWSDIDTFEELLSFYKRYKGRTQTSPWAGEKTLSFLLTLEKFKMFKGPRS